MGIMTVIDDEGRAPCLAVWNRAGLVGAAICLFARRR